MSAREFAVPCARCGLSEESHIDTSLTLFVEDWTLHAYTPDEHSVEWAALKLREALEIAAPYVDGVASIYPQDSTDLHVKRVRADAVTCQQALTLAHMVGIRGS